MASKTYVVHFVVYLSKRQATHEVKKLMRLANIEEKDDVRIVFSPKKPYQGRLLARSEIGEIYEITQNKPEARLTLGNLLENALKK